MALTEALSHMSTTDFDRLSPLSSLLPSPSGSLVVSPSLSGLYSPRSTYGRKHAVLAFLTFFTYHVMSSSIPFFIFCADNMFSFFFITEQHLLFSLSLHLLMGTSADFIIITNSSVINPGIQVYLLCADFDSFGYKLRSGGITGSYDSSIFSFSRNLHNGYTDLYYQQQRIAFLSSHAFASICCYLCSWWQLF
jgi:hypothetical protein